jgi:hypothetical protein
MQPGQSLEGVTAAMLAALPEVFRQVRPDLVIVQGDTPSAYAAALCAFFRKIRVAHVEAGLRTFDLGAPWPEEGLRAAIRWRWRNASVYPFLMLSGALCGGALAWDMTAGQPIMLAPKIHQRHDQHPRHRHRRQLLASRHPLQAHGLSARPLRRRGGRVLRADAAVGDRLRRAEQQRLRHHRAVLALRDLCVRIVHRSPFT